MPVRLAASSERHPPVVVLTPHRKATVVPALAGDAYRVLGQDIGRRGLVSHVLALPLAARSVPGRSSWLRPSSARRLTRLQLENGRLPGLRDLPRILPLHRLIWRHCYRQRRGAPGAS
jgi:hypothetical protein